MVAVTHASAASRVTRGWTANVLVACAAAAGTAVAAHRAIVHATPATLGWTAPVQSAPWIALATGCVPLREAVLARQAGRVRTALSLCACAAARGTAGASGQSAASASMAGAAKRAQSLAPRTAAWLAYLARRTAMGPTGPVSMGAASACQAMWARAVSPSVRVTAVGTDAVRHQGRARARVGGVGPRAPSRTVRRVARSGGDASRLGSASASPAGGRLTAHVRSATPTATPTERARPPPWAKGTQPPASATAAGLAPRVLAPFAMGRREGAAGTVIVRHPPPATALPAGRDTTAPSPVALPAAAGTAFAPRQAPALALRVGQGTTAGNLCASATVRTRMASALTVARAASATVRPGTAVSTAERQCAPAAASTAGVLAQGSASASAAGLGQVATQPSAPVTAAAVGCAPRPASASATSPHRAARPVGPTGARCCSFWAAPLTWLWRGRSPRLTQSLCFGEAPLANSFAAQASALVEAPARVASAAATLAGVTTTAPAFTAQTTATSHRARASPAAPVFARLGGAAPRAAAHCAPSTAAGEVSAQLRGLASALRGAWAR